MNIKDELKKILIVIPVSAILMFAIDYFFNEDGEYSVWVLGLSLIIFYWAIHISGRIGK